MTWFVWLIIAVVVYNVVMFLLWRRQCTRNDALVERIESLEYDRVRKHLEDFKANRKPPPEDRSVRRQ